MSNYKELMQSHRNDWKNVRRGYSKDEKNDYERQVRDYRREDNEQRDKEREKRLDRSRSRSRDRSDNKSKDNIEIKEEKKEEYKPNFGLSGALAKDERTGNSVNGIVLKYMEPFEASIPDKNWRLFVYKGKDIVDTLHIHRKSFYFFGRDHRVAGRLTLPSFFPSCFFFSLFV
jgi:smad nuclear-interacting protein 1